MKKTLFRIFKGILIFLLIVLAIAGGILTYNMWLNQTFVTTFYTVTTDKDIENMRIVELSDLHLREYGEKNADLVERIRNLKQLRFSQLIAEDAPTPLVVVTFLAVLELYKRSMVRVEQSQLFGDIDIEYIEGSGELLLDGDDALTSVGEE